MCLLDLDCNDPGLGSRARAKPHTRQMLRQRGFRESPDHRARPVASEGFKANTDWTSRERRDNYRRTTLRAIWNWGVGHLRAYC